ncbi:hypothetical protein [Vibrio gangliei]|uniref:hypothetical protein n=1 Tax=Vibrio gangliei TaxID=2077090 RepID=UPI000D01C4E2|nr:hypothetical protein [Vibrio gangliei]
MNKFIFLILSFLVSFTVNAEILHTSSGTITQLITYDDVGAQERFEGADVVAFFDTGITTCPNGVWISPDAPGYSTIVSFLLTAYTTKSNIEFQIYDDQIWFGSKLNKMCKIDAIWMK